MSESPKVDSSTPGQPTGDRGDADPGSSTFAGLPRTRPQRTTARSSNSRAGSDATELPPELPQNVLAGLPRSRPQRASARRDAARSARARAVSTPTSPTSTSTPASAPKRTSAAPTKPAGAHARAAKRSPAAASSETADAGAVRARRRPSNGAGSSKRPARPRAARGGARPQEEPVPRQGFEAEPERLSGPVQPPGGAELILSAGEFAGELAKTGVTAGARALKDLLSHLPG